MPIRRPLASGAGQATAVRPESSREEWVGARATEEWVGARATGSFGLWIPRQEEALNRGRASSELCCRGLLWAVV